ncbi:MAG: cupin domain-containing protein [Acidobacteria bacterium]|nr:cupin domain-containing protein [Acidobacteriota bacterium]
MLEERSGWFIVNVKDARWAENPAFGRRCLFEKEEPFPQTGVRIAVLEPGKPNCRYHRESAQEDFLVLSGECLLLVNGEERRLKAWDYVHCPPAVSHVFVGAGDGPCTILMIGHRPPDIEIFYPKNDRARSCNAEAPEPTPEPRVAYSDVTPWKPIDPPSWPID